MVQVTALCNEIERVSILRECGKLKIKINEQRIETLKSSAVCFSDLIKEKCILNKQISSVETDLYIKCKDSINILKKFIDTGILEFQEDEDHYHDIFEFGKYFRNQFLIQLYIKHIKSDSSITNENVFPKYEISIFENDLTTQNQCLEYISSHLYCLNDAHIIEYTVQFGYDFFEKILTSKSLKIEKEDKLCMLLLEICKQDNKFFDLFRYISLEYCTSHTFEEIYIFSVENSFEPILLKIYYDILKHSNKIRKLEISDSSNSLFEKYLQKNQFEISINDAHEFVLISERINAEFSSSSVKFGKITDINTYSIHNDFTTRCDSANQWVRVDLKGYKLKPSSYILLSAFTSSYLLRFWRLEGIKENGSTVILDNKNYSFQHNETKEFPLQTSDYFVAFKLIQTGKNQHNKDDDNELSIQVFDFKGELIKI
ncbi:hypothetical protein TVAG_428610 [Trichomonas vaginalis G3]|uniref:BACK domain-containing protein n=1 Tax=Trichomonas vaginalis (strain ATCC PRA-98 / G3) TaxID=412133 RepID=A2FJ51_TRIV3|nr:spectrin binding [Trichomonas vaginalis G3]EAX95058.1 hypothetical protein TVAG_428610 [Trichomonas vaginalis G3]KAI5484700.1 spectrin binding [Trichomonas vaginalis G3]|eukprot:XP_001307988.1 hypothetical protein [Trichomonas vaginalis G3]